MKLSALVRALKWVTKVRAKRRVQRRHKSKAAALNDIKLAEEEAKEMIDYGFDESDLILKGIGPALLRERVLLDRLNLEVDTCSYSSESSEKHLFSSRKSVDATIQTSEEGTSFTDTGDERITLMLIENCVDAEDTTLKKPIPDMLGSICRAGTDEEFSQSHMIRRRSIQMTKVISASLPELEAAFKMERIKGWASFFRRADPRFQIASFFQEIALSGITVLSSTTGAIEGDKKYSMPRISEGSSVFTVWRPTSMESIRKMMKGLGVGKGLDIKGKSAKCGALSGYVPFLQLYEEHHKKMIRTLPKDSSMRIFFKTRELRDKAIIKLTEVGEEMIQGWINAQLFIASGTADEEAFEASMSKFMWEMTNPEIVILDDYAGETRPTFGVEIPERLFWEAYVMRQNTHREPGTPDDIGRSSEPAFQDMNFASIRNSRNEDQPRAVVYQSSLENEMCPLNLLVAYEENKQISPVVSDFDCFLVGTKGVPYDEPLPDSQVSLLKWCIESIDEILGASNSASWTSRWLTVLKEKPVKPNMPKYGFGDPKSYHVMEQAVSRLSKDGCVRHGAECFNYYFPQELDDHFLVINDGQSDRKSPWKYVDVKGLQEILLRKIGEGYTFPLNPKWILCDPGWKEVYDTMRASEAVHVQNALNCWYPPESGIREMIEVVHAKHVTGFIRKTGGSEMNAIRKGGLLELGETEENEGTAAMDLAEQALERYRVLQRAKTKLSAVFKWMKYALERQAEATEQGKLKGAEGSIEDLNAPLPCSLSEQIHQRIVLHSQLACHPPGQHVRVRSSMLQTPLSKDLQTEPSFVL